MTFKKFPVDLAIISIALAFLFNLERFSVTAKMEIYFPTGTLISGSTTEYKVELRMQGATPTMSSLTQCTGFKFTTQQSINPIYAVQFTGHAPSSIVHHLVLYGCSAAPSLDPCSCPVNQRTNLFASTLNTPPIRFETVDGLTAAMKIGGTVPNGIVRYVFLEVHYVSASAIPDTSTGVDVQYVKTEPTYYVGILSFMAAGSIAAGQTEATVDACVAAVSSKIVGYQIHAHSLGTIVSIYHKRTSTGVITEVGRWNPQFPQVYFQRTSIQASGSDVLALRCVYNTVGETQTVYTIGVPGQKGTEMCFGNIVYVRGVASTQPSFVKGTSCSTNFIQSSSLTPLPESIKLSNHALYGNETGIEILDSSHTVDLDLLTFT